MLRTVRRVSLLALLALVRARSASAQGFPLGVRFDLATGNAPFGVAIGDVNGDGRGDLVVANGGSNTVSVQLGIGSGQFGPKTDFATALSPTTVVIGDVNEDGKADLVVADLNSNSVSVLLGNGSGGFGAHTDIPVGSTPYTVAIGDVNGDGHLDLAATNYNSNTVSVLLGNGAGSFAAAPGSPLTTAVHPGSVAIGDLNNDGKPDLAVTNQGSASVSVFLGNGAGGFGARTDFAVGAGPQLVVIADLNGDRKSDLVTSANATNSVSVLLGDGAGGFAAHVDYPVGVHPQWHAVGDVNGDGYPDIAVPNYNSNSVSILLGDGSGGFGAASDVAIGSTPVTVAIGDLNGDGRRDIAVTNQGSNSVSVLLAAPIAGDLWPLSGNGVATAIGDLNGDGLADIALATGVNTVQVFLASSTGLGAATTYATGAQSSGVAFQDLNGDGKLDMIVTNRGDATVSAYVNLGGGTFAAPTTSATISNPSGVTIQQIGPYQAPVVMSNGFNRLTLLQGNGDGTIQDHGPGSLDYVTGPLPYSIAAGDIDNDGNVDLMTGNGADASFVHHPLFVPSTTTSFAPTGSGGYGVALGDLNGDGKADLAVATMSSTVPVYLNTGSGLPASPSVTLPVNTLTGVSGTAWPIKMTDVNGDGRQDIVVAAMAESASHIVGRVYQFLGNGAGGFGSRIDIPAPVLDVALGDVNGDGRLDIAGGGGVLLTPSATRTVLARSPATVTYGSNVTLTATVQPTRIVPKASTIGTVSFFDGMTPLGSAPVSWTVAAGSPPMWTGHATLSPSMIRLGVRSLSAVYGGDGRRAGSIATPVTVLVQPGAVGVDPERSIGFGIDRTTNPAIGGRLRVSFSLPTSEPAKLEAYDLNGRRVAVNRVGALGAGAHVVDLHVDRPGMYFVRLEQGSRVAITHVIALE